MKFLHDVFARRTKTTKNAKLTFVVDKFQGLIREEFDALSEYVDAVKIRWGLPLLVGMDFLRKRIGYYHSRSVRVSTGGTLCELMLRRGRFSDFIEEAATAGFDIIELSDATFPVSNTRFLKMAQEVASAGMEFIAKAGRKDMTRQLSPDQLFRILDRGFDAGSKLAVIEAGEGFGAGIYRPDGTPGWELVDRLDARYGHDCLVFEAPHEMQQASLILHFGPDVNIGAIELDQVASVESMRVGVRAGDTLGMRPGPRKVTGGPAVKFIYHLVSTEMLADQSRLCNLSGLPRRTVQLAVEKLENAGLISSSPSLEDTRRKMYRAV